MSDAPSHRTQPAAGKVPVSVIILTKNESAFIERCMQGVAWADDIVVVDSGSTDDTRERAAALGARVFEIPWRGWVPQRQEGIARARHDWVFILEADEMVDETLAAAIRAAIAGDTPPDPADGYTVERRDRFFGLVLPQQRNRRRQRAFVRIFNRRRSHYHPEHIIHEEVVFPGRSIPLRGTLLHCRGFTFGQQMARYLEVAGDEADQMERRGTHASALKVLAWPVLRFLWVYVKCGGWRLGGPGLVHALMVATSEYMRWALLWERQHVLRGAARPAEAPTAASGAGEARRVQDAASAST
ncbi:glycosyltransferase family 2 protein [Falsiroseomonas sp.]|uniref:glycosyltransferase family 2 protein n=1 Tax=Falsiroseomonas sp. TaxID=2870721 RepID=UPI0035678CAA